MSQHTTAQAITQFRGLFRSLILAPALFYVHILSAETIARIVL